MLPIKPHLFTPVGDGVEKVFIEQYDGFDIYWYKWARDGVANVPDYEPVIILYKDQEPCMVILRRGWEYKPYHISELKFPPLSILFEILQHHPSVQKKKDRYFSFKKRISSKIGRKYEVEEVEPSQIPALARTGKNHPTRPRSRKIQDPTEKAKEYHEKFCSA